MHKFLCEAVDEDLIKPHNASLALLAWRYIQEQFDGKIEPPAACAGPDRVYFGWNGKEYLFEIEIYDDDSFSFFFKNRTTGENWFEEYSEPFYLSELAIEAMEKFIKEEKNS